jgi:MFS family permease
MDFQRPLAWNLSRAGLRPVFSASLAGLMIGLLIIGPLSDHVGRKLAIEHLRAERLHEKVKPLLRPL